MRSLGPLALALVLALLFLGWTPASAEEVKMNSLQTALSSTTISGYVDTSVEWTLGDKDQVLTQSVPTSVRRSSWWNSIWVWLRTNRWI